MRSVSAAKIIRSLSVAATAMAGVLLATGVAVAASMKADVELSVLSPELGDLALAIGLLTMFAAGVLLAIGMLMRASRTTI